MNPSFWSDEDRWFRPRTFGLGYSLNLKYVAKRLGWIRPKRSDEPAAPPGEGSAGGLLETREERLRRRADESKYEGNS